MKRILYPPHAIFILCAVTTGFLYGLLHMAGDIQEDAFITYRVAENIANHAHFGFNLDRVYASSTSFLYPLLIASQRILFGDPWLYALMVTNTLAVILSCYLIEYCLRPLFDYPKMMRKWVILALIVNPVSILVAMRGMETPWVILFTCSALHALSPLKKNTPCYSLVSIGLLPWIRPDAVAISLLILTVMAVTKRPRLKEAFVYFFLSMPLLLFCHIFCYGSPLPASIHAKLVSMPGTDVGWMERFLSIPAVYFNTALFFPVTTKYVLPFMLWVGLIAFVFLTGVTRHVMKKKSAYLPIYLCISGIILLIPAAYAWGGVVYEWYLWPSRFCFQSLVVTYGFSIMYQQSHRHILNIYAIFLTTVIIGFTALQGLLTINQGTQEKYRASVGKYLRTISQPNDLLFLEPAGAIPFHAKLKTVDEVGLASPDILSYIKKYPDHWWIEAVTDLKPEWLVQRSHLRNGKTLQGKVLTSEEIQQLSNQYELVKTFQYIDFVQKRNPWIQKILRMGSHPDYDVYKKIVVN